MLSTMFLLKPAVLDVGLLLRQSSSYWVMNGEKFAYFVSVSVFLRQVLSVFF